MEFRNYDPNPNVYFQEGFKTAKCPSVIELEILISIVSLKTSSIFFFIEDEIGLYRPVARVGTAAVSE